MQIQSRKNGRSSSGVACCLWAAASTRTEQIVSAVVDFLAMPTERNTHTHPRTLKEWKRDSFNDSEVSARLSMPHIFPVHPFWLQLPRNSNHPPTFKVLIYEIAGEIIELRSPGLPAHLCM